MMIEIRGHGVRLTKTQRARVERRLGFALSRFGERIRQVKLRFSHSDDDDLCCRIDVSLQPQILRVAHSDADLFVALDRAADRAGRSVARALARERELT